MPKPSSRHDRVAQILHEADQLIAAVQEPQATRNKFQAAFDVLRRISREEKIPLAFVGGTAVIHHGYLRSTDDLDVVVSTEDFDRLIAACPRYGIRPIGWNPFGFHELTYGGVTIDVLKEGTRGPTNPPRPDLLGVTRGADFTHLAGLFLLKMQAGRAKDEADLVEIIKKLPKDALKPIARYLREHAPALIDDFKQLVSIARSELDWGRTGGRLRRIRR